MVTAILDLVYLKPALWTLQDYYYDEDIRLSFNMLYALAIVASIFSFCLKAHCWDVVGSSIGQQAKEPGFDMMAGSPQMVVTPGVHMPTAVAMPLMPQQALQQQDLEANQKEALAQAQQALIQAQQAVALSQQPPGLS